jgi:hypothetical protein
MRNTLYKTYKGMNELVAKTILLISKARTSDSPGEPLLEIIHENGKTLMHKVKNPGQEQATRSHNEQG